MSILGRLFKKDDSVEEEKEKTIRMEDVERLMNDRLKKDFHLLESSVKAEYDSIQRTVKFMKAQIKILENATYPEATYPAISSRSVSGRKNFVSKMNIFIDNVSKPVSMDIDSFLEFYEKMNSLIASTNRDTTKDYALLKMLFEQEGKEVVKSFKQIVESNRRLVEILGNIRKSSHNLRQAKDCVSEINRLQAEIKKSKNISLNSSLHETEDIISKKEAEIKSLTESDEWKKILDEKKCIDILKEKMKEKIHMFDSWMDKIEVPLKKYKRVSEDKIIEDYLNKSFKHVLHHDKNGDNLMSIIREIEIMIIEGRLNLKGCDEFLPDIGRMKNENIIGKIFDDYLRMAEESEGLERKIETSSILKKKLKLEKELESHKSSFQEMKDDRKETEDMIKTLKEKNEKDIGKLESLLLDTTGEKMTIE